MTCISLLYGVYKVKVCPIFKVEADSDYNDHFLKKRPF